MPKAKTSAAAKNEWNEKAYDRVIVMVKAGEKEKLDAAAKAKRQSINRFILESINTAHPGLLTLLDNTSKQKKASDPTGDGDV